MAESFLFSIAESLIEKLASHAFQEASRVVGLYDDLRYLTKTLSLVKAVLLDAQQKQDHNHQLCKWLTQLKIVFSEAEDVLDEFECQTLRNKVVKAYGSTKDKVSHFFSTSNPLLFRYQMAQQIKDINNRLNKVAADRHKFSLQIIDVDTRVVHRRDMTHSRVSDSDVMGRKDDKEKIIQLLMQQNPNDDDDTSLSVIPIVGIGGLGKTTLAKFVFNDNRIQECFPLKMWVCVSDDFDIKQLITKIINSASDEDVPSHQQNLNMLDLEQLQKQLKRKLFGQKLLLVLDDVWNEDRVKWVELRNLIQVSGAGSKVVVTTRSHSIASMMGTVPSHNLEGLSEQDCWSLFVKWAFKEGEEEKHPHLLNIGREILKKCKGVPLAVRTLGSLLFSKFEDSEWKHVNDNEIWNLAQKKDDILPALKLSYDLMPSYLRQCFALFSLYPKDYRFVSYEIASIWGSLGLIALPKTNTNRTLEDVANQYLHELLSRSFLQDFENFGTVDAFRIHDLVHDLALFVAKDECLHVSSNIKNIPENVRHLSFAESSLFDNLVIKKSAAVRSLLFPNGTTSPNSEALVNACLSKFKCLRYLDLSDSTFETLPRSIAKLKHLRYLDISKNLNIKRLPESVCKLQSLQVLSIKGCMELEVLPRGLRKLISIHRLEFSTKQTVLPVNEMAKLGSLEYLSVSSCHNVESIFGGVKFPSLKTLCVWNCQSLKSLWLDGQNFPELETLVVGACGNLDLELCKGNHEEESPKLKLKFIGFNSLSQLVALPKWLQEAAKSLQCLFVSNCHNIETLPDWLSTMTNLKTLCLSDCPNLVSISDNIHHLTALETLTIEGCEADLCKKYKPHVGEFWPKISRIKNIVIN